MHRATQDESLDRDLAYAFTLLPERWAAATAALRAARHDTIAEPERALRALLEASAETRPYLNPVLGAFRNEPEPTRFGLVQAITRAAQSLAPDQRFDLEAAAGRLLDREAVAS